MPRSIDLDYEIRLAQAQLAKDASFTWSFVLRPQTPLYLRILQSCKAAGEKQVSVYVRNILDQYFTTEASGGIELNPRQQETLEALCSLWKVEPKEALVILFEKAAATVLKEEVAGEKERMSILKLASSK